MVCLSGDPFTAAPEAPVTRPAFKNSLPIAIFAIDPPKGDRYLTMLQPTTPFSLSARGQ
jgi:hypothetical protein